jgi:23S rRNA (uridine2552-2'-O)-methyltransferase
MHHLYNIFKEGDRVIDIGAGSMGWTDMAIKYTKSPSDDPLVISLDEKDLPKVAGTIVVKGDFLDK